MKVVALVAATLVACNGSESGSPDAMPDPGNVCVGVPPRFEQASCMGASASTSIYLFSTGAGSHSMCGMVLEKSDVQCAGGCAVNGSLLLMGVTEISYFGSDAAVLCAETVEAKVGDACNVDGTHPCLPTRAQLNTDGTVASQNYLACTANHCEVANPPVVANYLLPCDSTIVQQYGTQGVNGALAIESPDRPDCLLAWDDTTQSITSGRSRQCIGDWECPVGSLCDDQIATIGGSNHAPVCKPGPRGTLTPSMLSP